MEKLHLILTNPCSSDWDGMEEVRNGRHCNSCDKNVVDLTGKSDAELIKFFKTKNDNVCGRLLASQLNRPLLPPPARTNWRWLLPLSVGAIFISPAQASEFKPVILQQNDRSVDAVPAVVDSAEKGLLRMDTIKGKVVADEGGAPLKGVKVRQKGFQNVLATTDSLGQFELNLPNENTPASLTFQHDGYVLSDMQPKNGMVVKLKVMLIRLGGVHVISANNGPMYYVYAGKKGCVVDEDAFKQIQPEWIEKIEILKDASATAIYGSRAANGVIIIGIKKQYAKKVKLSHKKR